MVLFSTILPVKEGITEAHIMEAVTAWEKDKKLSYQYEELPDMDVYHYAKSDGIPWTQTFAYDKKEQKIHIMQETTHKVSSSETLESKYCTPSIIRFFIEDGILQDVYKCPVKEFNENSVLPELILNSEKLAKIMAFRLKGAAQVMHGNENSLKINGKKMPVALEGHLIEAVHKVLEYGRHYLYDPAYSWENIKKEVSFRKETDRMNNELTVKDKAVLENEELVAAYEEENASLKMKITAANNRLSASSAKISGLENCLSDKAPVLFYGDELDMYEGEIKDLVISLIEKEEKNTPDLTRKKDILKSLLAANELTNKKEDILSHIKTAFRNYKTLTGSQKMLLESLGFRVDVSGDHYKIHFKDDDRYLVVLSRTASDHREGRNFTSCISTTMF